MVVDTNVFVAAAFNPASSSAQVVKAVREGYLLLAWDAQTRRESKRILTKIPPISWAPYEDLFLEESRFDGPLDLDAYRIVPDAEDRKFAALAAATGSILVTQDHDLLGQASRLPIIIVTPTEFLAKNPPQQRARQTVLPTGA